MSSAITQELNEEEDPAQLRSELDAAFNLCVDALAQDDPVDITRGAWAGLNHVMLRGSSAPK